MTASQYKVRNKYNSPGLVSVYLCVYARFLWPIRLYSTFWCPRLYTYICMCVCVCVCVCVNGRLISKGKQLRCEENGQHANSKWYRGDSRGIAQAIITRNKNKIPLHVILNNEIVDENDVVGGEEAVLPSVSGRNLNPSFLWFLILVSSPSFSPSSQKQKKQLLRSLLAYCVWEWNWM